ncbi:synaptosomal-associated protein 29 [Biomphalaria pfeifferi]|uniref:Synaptosomal-associated protein 29 n=1 Tax=Biomphalaria pfeifferi TaxID=112525 RepID=A0AAD8BRP0_BIOPF|nr:synaptosomal-associated protein 29 [Biomphalaria pfeifferi]
MSRYHQSSNPFDEDDDDIKEDDFVVVDKNKLSQTSTGNSNRYTAPSQPVKDPRTVTPATSNKSATSSYSYGNSNGQARNAYPFHNSESEDNPFEDRRQYLQRQIENSENTQLESTQRALASIYDSEAMGIATAEELMRQGETLNNIESKTDSMQQNLKTSQRHLNNIKSVFGGIKNWWSTDKKQANSTAKLVEANSRLKAALETSEKSKPDVRGFYDDDDLDSKFMASARKPVSGQYTMITPVTRSGREEEVDQNLALMGDGMSRLKSLALGLGDEIEKQNEQLDRINTKVDSTDILLGHQNTQMKRILKN